MRTNDLPDCFHPGGRARWLHFRNGLAFALALLSGAPAPGASQAVLRATRDLTIDAESNNLSLIATVAASARGVIAVVQPQDGLIRFFDPAGHALGIFGRNGEGPGEFKRFSLVDWKADTLWVLDPALNRITFIGPDRKVIRMLPLSRTLKAPRDDEGANATFGTLYTFAPLDHDILLASVGSPRATMVPAWLPIRDPQASSYVQTTADGRFRRVVYLAPPASGKCERRVAEDDDNHTESSFVIPFCDFPNAVGNDGRLVQLSGAPATKGKGSFRLLVIDAVHGDTAFNREYSYDPVPIPSRVTDSVRHKLSATADRMPKLKKAYESLELPRYYLPVGRVVLGRDGTIWLGDGNVSSPLQRWRILDGKGAVTGLVDIPRNVRILAVQRGMAWGLETDGDGLQNVVRFTLK